LSFSAFSRWYSLRGSWTSPGRCSALSRLLRCLVLRLRVLLCAAVTFRSRAISSFLKIFVCIFSTETIVFGLAVLAGRAGLWPADYAEYLPPELLPQTVAIFSILVYLVAQFGKPGARVGIVDAFAPTSEHGTPPRVLRCELAAIGYREISLNRLNGSNAYLAVFAPPSVASRTRPETIAACKSP
jgi:hypothetical protein